VEEEAIRQYSLYRVWCFKNCSWLWLLQLPVKIELSLNSQQYVLFQTRHIEVW